MSMIDMNDDQCKSVKDPEAQAEYDRKMALVNDAIINAWPIDDNFEFGCDIDASLQMQTLWKL